MSPRGRSRYADHPSPGDGATPEPQGGPPPAEPPPLQLPPERAGAAPPMTRRERERLVAEDQLKHGEEPSSVGLAALNLDNARDWASQANLYREEPEEHQGVPIKGYCKKFLAPFDVADIEEWTKRYRGGGRYGLWIYDGDKELVIKHTFNVEGRPMLPGKEDEEPKPGAAAPPVPGHAGAYPAGPTQREQDLERALAESKTATLLAEQKRQFDQMIQAVRDEQKTSTAALTATLERLSAALTAQKPAAETMAPIMAALSPVFVEMAKKPLPPLPAPPQDHFKDIAALVAGMTAQKPADPFIATILKSLADKALGRDESDPKKLVHDLLGTIVPSMAEHMIDIARMKAEGGGGSDELSPRYIADKVTEMINPILAKVLGSQAAQPSAAPPSTAGYLRGPDGTIYWNPGTGAPPIPVQAPPPPAALPAPMIPPGTRGGDPFAGAPSVVTPRPQPAPAPAPAPLAAPTAAPAPAGPIASAGHPSLAPVAATPPGGGGAAIYGGGAVGTQPAPQVQGAPGPRLDDSQLQIHAIVYKMAVGKMQEGKSGTEFAEEIDGLNPTDEAVDVPWDQRYPYISKQALQAIETTPPDILVQSIVEACPEPLRPHLSDPRATPFITAFCGYFYGSTTEPDDGGPGAPAVG